MPRTAPTVVVSSKGQIVIPAAVRRRVGLAMGRRVRIDVRDREVVLTLVEPVIDEVERQRERARAWAARTGRDLIDELHRRRDRERSEEARERRRP